MDSRLPPEEYIKVIERTHLVSVDLLLHTVNDEYLLGLRTNSPAAGTLFVPGSRMYKKETPEECLIRVGRDECGINIDLTKVNKRGVYYHHHPDNFINDKFGTHYLVLPCSYQISHEMKALVDEKMTAQHSEVVWMTAKQIKDDSRVHSFVKQYFTTKPTNCWMSS